MCLERRTGPVAAAVGVVAVVLCWSSVAWTAGISKTSTTPDPNTLAAQFGGIEIAQSRNGDFSGTSQPASETISIPDESLFTAIPSLEEGNGPLVPFQTFPIAAVGGVGPSSDLMIQPLIPGTVQPLTSSDDGQLAFPVNEPNTFDFPSARFDSGRYPDAMISGAHDSRDVGAVQGAPVPEPAIVGGLLALALLAFITWRKRYG